MARTESCEDNLKKDTIFIGNARDAAAWHRAGVLSFAPSAERLGERVMAERARCRVLAMTQETLTALPAHLVRELRESTCPKLKIVPATQAQAPLAA